MKKIYQKPQTQLTRLRLATVVNGVSATVDAASLSNEGSETMSAKGRGGRDSDEWADLW